MVEEATKEQPRNPAVSEWNWKKKLEEFSSFPATWNRRRTIELGESVFFSKQPQREQRTTLSLSLSLNRFLNVTI